VFGLLSCLRLRLRLHLRLCLRQSRSSLSALLWDTGFAHGCRAVTVSDITKDTVDYFDYEPVGRRPALRLIVEIAERLPVGVANDEARIICAS
jgi:hypothetical protein